MLDFCRKYNMLHDKHSTLSTEPANVNRNLYADNVARNVEYNFDEVKDKRKVKGMTGTEQRVCDRSFSLPGVRQPGKPIG